MYFRSRAQCREKYPESEIKYGRASPQLGVKPYTLVEISPLLMLKEFAYRDEPENPVNSVQR